MNAQEIYNTVRDHILTQGVPAMEIVKCSVGDYPDCKYRTKEGLSCAFGCLIPDHRYNPSMESKLATLLINSYFPEYVEHKNLISNLQRTHDVWAMAIYKNKPFNIVDSLKEIAKMHNLQA